MKEKSVVIVGGGMMGCGIAAVAASARNSVTVVEPVEAQRARGPEKVSALLEELDRNGLACLPAAQARQRVAFTGDLPAACQSASLVIEAIVEDLPAKQSLFVELDRLVPEDVPIVSNTSGLRITDIGTGVTHKNRIATAHFWFPAHIVPLVEVVMGDGTSPDTANSVRDTLAEWGKKPVIVKKDLPGQLANRILQAMIREASSIVEMGLASPEDIDTAIKMGIGIRLPAWGILEHADGVGMDLIEKVQDTVLPGISTAQQANPVVSQMVAEGNLGYKTGKGFYDWGCKDMTELQKRRDAFIVHAVRFINGA